MSGAAEVPATLECTGELARHDLRVESGVVDLRDLESRILEFEILLQTALQFVDDLALATDDHADALGVQRDLGALGCALEIETTEAGALGLGEQELSDQLALDIAVDELANRALLLRHQYSSSSSSSSAVRSSRKISRLTW